MALIAGIWDRSDHCTSIEGAELMLTSLKYLPFAHTRSWFNPPIWLGTCEQLDASTTLAQSQPFSYECNGIQLHMVFDGKINNRKDLIHQLGVEENISVPELILNAYLQWGAKSVSRIQGNFAFIIWDQANQKMFCARDRLGVKPFFYYLRGSIFAFASQAKQILSLPGVHSQVNNEAIAFFLTSCWEEIDSFFDDIQILHPGHYMILDHSGITHRKYWPDEKLQQISYCNVNDYRDQFIDLLNKSISNNVDPMDHVGISLSGGLDSSSIMCLAESAWHNYGEKPRPIGYTNTYTFYRQADEQYYVESIYKKYSSEHVYIPSDDHLTLKYINHDPCPDIPWYMPFEGGHRALSQTASNDGIHIILTGVGGDELLASHTSSIITDLARVRNWKEIYFRWKKQKNGFETLARVIYAFLPMYLTAFYEQSVLSRFAHERPPLPTFLTKKTSQQIQPCLIQRNVGSTRSSFPNLYGQEVYSVLTKYTTKVKTSTLDRNALDFGIELRHPFLDAELVQFIMSIPPTQVYTSTTSKYLLRQSLKDILPEIISSRRGKASLNKLAIKGMKEQAVLLRELFQNSIVSELGYVDRNKVLSELEIFLQKSSFDHSWVHFWSLFSLEWWLRLVLKQPFPSSAQLLLAPEKGLKRDSLKMQ